MYNSKFGIYLKVTQLIHYSILIIKNWFWEKRNIESCQNCVNRKYLGIYKNKLYSEKLVRKEKKAKWKDVCSRKKKVEMIILIKREESSTTTIAGCCWRASTAEDYHQLLAQQRNQQLLSQPKFFHVCCVLPPPPKWIVWSNWTQATIWLLFQLVLNMALDEEPENVIVPGQGLRRVIPLSMVSAIGFSGKFSLFSNAVNHFWRGLRKMRLCGTNHGTWSKSGFEALAYFT